MFLNTDGLGKKIAVEGDWGPDTRAAAAGLAQKEPKALQIFMKKLGGRVTLSWVIDTQTKVEFQRLFGQKLESWVETKGVEFIIPAIMLKNSAAMKELKRYGIIKGNKVIMENSDVIGKFQKYQDYFNFIHDTARISKDAEIKDKKGLMDRYIALINEGTDWIDPRLKEALQYKYAEAIYNDIIRMGCILQRNTRRWHAHGEYEIIGLESGDVDEANPYNRVLTVQNARDLLDVARVSSMVRKDFTFNTKGLVGEKSLVKHLLTKHEIVDVSGHAIMDPEHMLLDKPHALRQIRIKKRAILGKPRRSAQAYQELTFLEEQIRSTNIWRETYARGLLTKVNLFKGFVKQKALIGGFSPDKIAGAKDKDFGAVAADLIKQNQFGLLVFAFISWMMGYKKAALGAAGVGLFGPSVANAVQGSINTVKSGFTDDDLEIIKPHTILPEVARDYKTRFSKLVEINTENMKKRVDTKKSIGGGTERTALPFVKNNFILAKIVGNMDKIGGIQIKPDDDPLTIAREIQDTDGTNWVLTRRDYPNYEGYAYDIHRNDIVAFVKMLQSSDFPRDGRDITLKDLLTEWVGLEHETYGRDIAVTGISEYDDALNSYMKEKWETTPEARKSIREIQKLLWAWSFLQKGLGPDVYGWDVRNTAKLKPQETIDKIEKLLVTLRARGFNAHYIGTLESFQTFVKAQKSVRDIQIKEKGWLQYYVDIGFEKSASDYEAMTEAKLRNHVAAVDISISELQDTQSGLDTSNEAHAKLSDKIDELIAVKRRSNTLARRVLKSKYNVRVNTHRRAAGLPELDVIPVDPMEIRNFRHFDSFFRTDSKAIYEKAVQKVQTNLEWVNINSIAALKTFLENDSLKESFRILSKLERYANHNAYDRFNVSGGGRLMNRDGTINHRKMVITTIRNKFSQIRQKIEDDAQSEINEHYRINQNTSWDIWRIIFDYDREIDDNSLVDDLIANINGVDMSVLVPSPSRSSLRIFRNVSLPRNALSTLQVKDELRNKLGDVVRAMTSKVPTEDNPDNLAKVKKILEAIQTKHRGVITPSNRITNVIRDIDAKIARLATRYLVKPLSESATFPDSGNFDLRLIAFKRYLTTLRSTAGAPTAAVRAANTHLAQLWDRTTTLQDVKNMLSTAWYDQTNNAVKKFNEWFSDNGM